MAASGAQVNPECLDAFQELKLGKKLKYIIYRMSKDVTEIVIEKKSELPSYEDFLKEFPPDDCRWAVYDLEYEKEGAKRNKLCFFSWAPDNARVKAKMVYASSKDALRKALLGIATEIQATDSAEIEYESVLQKVSRGN